MQSGLSGTRTLEEVQELEQALKVGSIVLEAYRRPKVGALQKHIAP